MASRYWSAELQTGGVCHLRALTITAAGGGPEAGVDVHVKPAGGWAGGVSKHDSTCVVFSLLSLSLRLLRTLIIEDAAAPCASIVFSRSNEALQLGASEQCVPLWGMQGGWGLSESVGTRGGNVPLMK